jgi:hypothetical protein
VSKEDVEIYGRYEKISQNLDSAIHTTVTAWGSGFFDFAKVTEWLNRPQDFWNQAISV